MSRAGREESADRLIGNERERQERIAKETDDFWRKDKEEEEKEEKKRAKKLKGVRAQIKENERELEVFGFEGEIISGITFHKKRGKESKGWRRAVVHLKSGRSFELRSSWIGFVADLSGGDEYDGETEVSLFVNGEVV